jgi:zinc/manganese transport system ATP-binding protein
VVTLENLTVSYRQHPALHHISGRFAQGSLTAVVGPNGSGKTTLLKSIMGLLPLDGGHLAVAAQRTRMAYLPQLSEIDRSFPISVGECVQLGCWAAKGAWGGLSGAQLARVQWALQTVGLDDFDQRPISTLSSGQLQRALFARLLVQDAELILLDEPFNAVDSKTTQALLSLLQLWHAQQRTVIAVVHDDAQVQQYFPQTLLLAREVVAWGQTAQVMIPAHLSQARNMAQAWNDTAPLCEVDRAVNGRENGRENVPVNVPRKTWREKARAR